jgi:hypothetical protein
MILSLIIKIKTKINTKVSSIVTALKLLISAMKIPRMNRLNGQDVENIM